jgi:hypothetical protein
MQLTFVACVASVDDDTEDPWSVSFRTVFLKLMKSDAGHSIPHTIPVIPDPAYHCLHTLSGVQAMTWLDRVWMKVVFMPLSWTISIMLALWVVRMKRVVL